ncbi:MAG: thioredoxin family protein [Oscillospiraceae bacterium]|nr:thioredoxin family protein [Oscillospiraceae bacterium]
MKKITMFTMRGCPYCNAALRWMDELAAEDPKYLSIEIEKIDEVASPGIASKYDYYYVPTYYIGGEKLHEGAASRDIIERVLNAALEE